MRSPHLVQYQGSKRNLAPLILDYMPKRFSRLIEPFSGTAAITLACAKKNYASEYIINDLNQPLINLFELVVDTPGYVAKRYEDIWSNQEQNSIEHYYQARDEFNNTKDPIIFLYLLARCVKGAVRYNSEGNFNQSPDKRRKGTNPSTMKKNIYCISELLKGRASFFSIDYKRILEVATTTDIVYMDPPYQGVCGTRDSRYFSDIDHLEFVEELRKLVKRKVPFILSYDGKCGEKNYGNGLPEDLGVVHIFLDAGRSTQATLLGKKDITFESLYLTKDLATKGGVSCAKNIS